MSGFQTSMLAIAVIAVILLGIHLLAPKSKLARVEDRAMSYVATHAPADWAKAEAFFATEADAIAAGWQKVAPTFESELLAMLTKIETTVLDTSGEDQDIADALAAVEKATNKRAARLAMGRDHMARVKAILDDKDPPAAA